ncbi:MAG: 3-isopropylmalate dehydratase small subunit [Anaerolineaceae bacterium]
MKKFIPFSSRLVVLPVNNIDTDQIIPARFLKVTDKLGLGDNLFSDWRYLPDGSQNPDFVLNKPASKGARILLAGQNFGSGSSREHAPWALMGYGFQVIISTSFADIFRNNSLKNGLIPAAVTEQDYQTLLALVTNDPNLYVEVDLADQALKLPSGETFHFPIDEFSKTCLLNGMDELEYLLSLEEKITAYETAAAGR